MNKCKYPDWEGGLIVGEHSFDKDGFCRVCGYQLPLKCDYCRQFIAWSDFDTGKAKRELDTLDSEFTSETYITYHVKCLEKMRWHEERIGNRQP